MYAFHSNASTLASVLLIGLFTVNASPAAPQAAKPSVPCAPAGSQPAAESMRAPRCRSGQLYMTFDGENGAFAGMQQNGALLVLRNVGQTACSVLPQPPLTFADSAGKSVGLEQKRPIGMHPGPVQIPVVIPAGAEATAVLHWVANPVFGGAAGGVCVTPARAVLPVEGGNLQAAFTSRVCGPEGRVPTYDLQTQLHRDPTWTPEAMPPRR